MKEKIKKIKEHLREYLLDILLLTGVWIASYNLLRPAVTKGLQLPSLTHTEHFTAYRVLGIMLVVLAYRYSSKTLFR